MEHELPMVPVKPSEKTTPVDPDRTLVPPRFDEKSVQRAQPATALGAVRGKRFLPFVLLVAFVVGLIGGVAGSRLVGFPRPGVDGSRPSSSSDATAPVGAVTGAARQSPEGDGEVSRAADGESQTELRSALDEWVAATNARDLDRQMGFYGEKVGAFYRTRDVTREAVRAEKARVFGNAEAIDIRAAAPDIRLGRDGRTATMRFRKKYAIEGGGEARRGEVLQELRWRRTSEGWKIVSERDLRVLN